MKTFPLLLLAACVLGLPAASVAHADGVAQSKPKATRESVIALRTKLAKASTDIRKLGREAAPPGLTADQKKSFDAEMAKLGPMADATDKTVAELDKMLADTKASLDSMSEMGEMESLRLQMAMDRLSKMMSTLSNLLKKISDTASQIAQNLK